MGCHNSKNHIKHQIQLKNNLEKVKIQQSEFIKNQQRKISYSTRVSSSVQNNQSVGNLSQSFGVNAYRVGSKQICWINDSYRNYNNKKQCNNENEKEQYKQEQIIVENDSQEQKDSQYESQQQIINKIIESSNLNQGDLEEFPARLNIEDNDLFNQESSIQKEAQISCSEYTQQLKDYCSCEMKYKNEAVKMIQQVFEGIKITIQNNQMFKAEKAFIMSRSVFKKIYNVKKEECNIAPRIQKGIGNSFIIQKRKLAIQEIDLEEKYLYKENSRNL